MKKINTKKITLAALLASLGVIFLLLGSVFSVLDLSACAFSAFFIIIAVIELKGFYPFAIYFTVSVLSLVLLPAKLPALMFICFFGFYPIFKSYVEKYHYIVSWAVKISLFNLLFALLIFVSKNLFFIQDPFIEFEFLIFLIANFAFLIYDIAVTQIITLYLIKIRRMLGLGDYFKNIK